MCKPAFFLMPSCRSEESRNASDTPEHRDSIIKGPQFPNYAGQCVTKCLHHEIHCIEAEFILAELYRICKLKSAFIKAAGFITAVSESWQVAPGKEEGLAPLIQRMFKNSFIANSILWLLTR